MNCYTEQVSKEVLVVTLKLELLTMCIGQQLTRKNKRKSLDIEALW